jgi:hypothetical protein
VFENMAVRRIRRHEKEELTMGGRKENNMEEHVCDVILTHVPCIF